ncbi:MAG: hypothetical protein OXT09_28375, partial [Myxococcales bacterium]|nr:hypothetical protein [Myxococcales bacterium]
MRLPPLAVLLAALLAFGCGDDGEPDDGLGDETSGDGDGVMDSGDGDGDDAAPDDDIPVATGDDYAGDPMAAISADCQGFDLEGLMYSPGGSVLPNTCEAFHPTWNNPYAVLCIHAWDWYDTGFLGDELCILPPEPGKGIQVGMHPMSPNYWEMMQNEDLSGYAAAAEDFVLPAGGEETRNFVNPSDNDAERNYYRTYFRMRTGSHHNIITLHPPSNDAMWIPGTGDALPGLFASPVGDVTGVLGGQQRPDDNTPVSFNKPDEDAGLYLKWPVDPTVLFNMHHFNVTDGDILK